MRQYLAMDIRRLFKTRSYYISILISLVLLAIFAGAAYFVTGFAQELTNTEAQGPMLAPAMLEQARKLMNLSFFASFYLSHNSFLHLIVALFAAGFIAKDHQTGYLKNLFGIRDLRVKWLFSKLIAMLLAAAVFYLVFLLACALVVLLYGNPISLDFADFAGYFALHLSVDLALFALICLVTALLQTKTAAVIVAMIISFNMQTILYLLIDSFGILPFKLRAWGMMGQASRLALKGGVIAMMQRAGGGSATLPSHLLPVSLGIFLGCTLMSLWALRRVDYKG